jgi:hypothetical protein
VCCVTSDACGLDIYQSYFQCTNGCIADPQGGNKDKDDRKGDGNNDDNDDDNNSNIDADGDREIDANSDQDADGDRDADDEDDDYDNTSPIIVCPRCYIDGRSCRCRYMQPCGLRSWEDLNLVRNMGAEKVGMAKLTLRYA